jgi:hypothetical protein
VVVLEKQRSNLHCAWAVGSRGSHVGRRVILVDKQPGDKNKRTDPTNTVTCLFAF